MIALGQTETLREDGTRIRTVGKARPEQPDLTGTHKNEILVAATSVSHNDAGSFDNIIQHHSSWYKLKRSVAVYITLCTILKDRIASKTRGTVDQLQYNYTPFIPDTLQEAEFAIVKYVQRQNFSRDIEQLTQKVIGTQDNRGRASKNTTTYRQSQIYRLDPFVDDGIIRVGGRLSRANIPEHTKHPILLPKKSHVTMLIIKHVHIQLAHAGRNHVISKLREHYWIISINSDTTSTHVYGVVVSEDHVKHKKCLICQHLD